MIKPEKLKDLVDATVRFLEAKGKKVLQIQCRYVGPWPKGTLAGYVIRARVSNCTSEDAFDFMSQLNAGASVIGYVIYWK